MKPLKEIFRKLRKKEEEKRDDPNIETILLHRLYEKEELIDIPFSDIDIRRAWLRFRREMKKERLQLISITPNMEEEGKKTQKNQKIEIPYKILEKYSTKEKDYFSIFLDEFIKKYENYYPDKNSNLKLVFKKGYFLSQTNFQAEMKQSSEKEKKNPNRGHPTEVLNTFYHFFELEFDTVVYNLHLKENFNNFKNPFHFPNLFEGIEIICRSYHNRLIILKKMNSFVRKILTYAAVLINLFLEAKDYVKNERFEFIIKQLKLSIQIISHFTESLDTLQMSPFQKCKELKLVYREEQKIQCNFLNQFGLTKVVVDVLQKLSIIFSTRTEMTFIFSMQEALLNIAQSIINCSPAKIIDHFTQGGGLQELLNYLNWPIELIIIISEKQDWQDVDMFNVVENRTRISGKNNQNRIGMYYDLQSLVLKLIYQILSRGRIYVENFSKLDGFSKIVSNGIWISFFLSREKKIEKCIETLKMNKPKYPPVNSAGEPICPGFIKKLSNEYFFNYFEIIEKIVTLSPIFGGFSAKRDANGMFDFSSLSDDLKPEKQLADMYLLFFNDKIESERKNDYIKKAREKLKTCNDFQLFFMDNLIKFCTSKEITIDVLISLGLYDVLFSDYFYFFGGQSNPTNVLKENRGIYSVIKDKKMEEYGTELSNALRKAILCFIVFFALKKKRSNYLEIRKFFDIMMTYQNNHVLLREISESLLVILKLNFEQSEKSLIKMKGFISMISHLISVTKEPKARNSLISVLNVMFESKEIHNLALIDRKTIDVLFSICFERTKDYEIHQKTMMEHIGALMRNESTGANFEMIVGSFCECFPKIQELMIQPNKEQKSFRNPKFMLSKKDSKFLITVLQTLQESLVTKKREILQNEFSKHFDKFLLLANVRSPISHDLCVEIFKTIRYLISKNKKNRTLMANLTSNFITLKSIVLNWCPNKQPSKQVISELFNILVDGEFHIENRSTIVNPVILILVFELFKHVKRSDLKMIVIFLKRFFKIIKGNVSNQHSCCNIELISYLFSTLDYFHGDFIKKHNHSRDAIGIIDYFIDTITILGKHSITVKETKSMVFMMKKHSRIYELPLFQKMVESMSKMLKKSPRTFFDCSGNASGLKIINDKLWPTYNVYSLSFWVRVEQFSEKMMIFSFYDKLKSGIDIFFEKEYIKVVVSKKDKKYDSEFLHQFKKDKWTYVVITHSSRALTKNTMKLYVDGNMVSKMQMKYPQLSGEGSCLYIGNDRLENFNCFRGQFGFINIFEDLLSLGTIKMLYSLGHNYISPFHPVDADLFDKETHPLFNSGLASKLCYSFNSKTGRVLDAKGTTICDNLAPNKKYRRGDAIVMEGTRLCDSQDIGDVISGIGGIKSFFPFILTNDEMLMKTGRLKQSSLNSLLSLIVSLLAHSESTREDYMRSYGSTVIAFLLKQISPQHINEETCQLMEKAFNNLKVDNELLFDFISNILFDFRVWIYAKSEFQKVIFQLLLEELHSKKSYFEDFKKVVPIQSFLDKMRLYYWIEKERDFSILTKKLKHPTSNKLIAERPNSEQIIEIRGILLRIFKRLFSQNPKDFKAEIKMVLDFMISCNDHTQLKDFSFILLEQFLAANQSNLIISNSFEVFVYLIGSRDEDVRINCIKCLGRYLLLNEKLISTYGADKIHGFDPLYKNLKKYYFTERTYRALRDVFLGTINLGDNDSDGILEENFKLKAIIPLIFQLIHFCDNDKSKLLILKDWREKLKHNPMIKKIILSQVNWQILWVRIIQSCYNLNSEENKQIFSVSMDIYSALIFYSLIEHQNGFSVLERAKATIFYYSRNYPNDFDENFKKPEWLENEEVENEKKKKKKNEFINSKNNTTIRKKKILINENKLDYNEMLSFLFERLLTAYIHLESISHKSIRSDKNNVLDNLVYLLNSIENFIFYSKGIKEMMDLIVKNMEKERRKDENDIDEELLMKFVEKEERKASHSRSNSKKKIDNSGSKFFSISRTLKFPFRKESKKRIKTGSFLDQDSQESSGNSSPGLLTRISAAAHDRGQSYIDQMKSVEPGESMEEYEKKVVENYFKINSQNGNTSGLSNLRLSDSIGTWLDLETAKKILCIIELYKFCDVVSFSQISPYVQTTHGLREGGFFRLTLRLIKTVFLNSQVSLSDNTFLKEIIGSNFQSIKHVLKKDRDMKKEINKLSDPSIVLSPTENKKIYENMYRLKLVLGTYFQIVQDLIRKNNVEIASMVLAEINNIFMLRKVSVMKHFQDDDKMLRMSLFSGSFIFFKDRSKVKSEEIYQDYLNFSKEKYWEMVCDKYFEMVFRKEAHLENMFLKGSVVQRNCYVYFVVLKKINLLDKRKKGTLGTTKRSKFYFIGGGREDDNYITIITKIKEIEDERIIKEKNLEEYLVELGSHYWKRTIKGITNDRGIWSKSNNKKKKSSPKEKRIIKREKSFSEKYAHYSSSSNKLNRWMVDPTENKYRMRYKIKRDFSGVDHSNASAAKRRLMSKKDEEKERFMMERRKMRENQLLKLKDDTFSTLKYVLVEESQRMSMKPPIRRESDSQKPVLTIEEKKEEDEEDDKKKEKVLISNVYCEIVTPMQAYSGQLEITTKKLLWYVDRENKCYTFEKNDRVSILEKVPKNKIWLISKITEIHPRRHQLAQSAIEIFFSNRKNIFLNFKVEERNKIFRKLNQTKPKNLQFIQKVGSPIENVKRSGITQLWVKGQISNFDYLMKLNTFANRSYNDLSQYPVFPWILCDYTSEKLDLSDPSVYRDLKKPIGALDPSVHKEIQRKFRTLQETGFDDPWMYGSHYSSSAIVNYYMIRIEPYTTFFRILQGGFFDHADRMFDSIPQTWKNCLTSGRDFKELIPEFFYFPEFLGMINKVDFGTKQSGQKLGGVKLPPWAKSAEDFIHKNRMALESEYVSQNLHHWIDLIFGYKQHGEEAIKADNLFRPYTYEHRVNIEAVSNERERLSIISEIQNFGQTPSQLFDSPHPQRKVCTMFSRMPKRIFNDSEFNNIFIKDCFMVSGTEVQGSGTIGSGKIINYIKVFPKNGLCCAVTPEGIVCSLKLSSNVMSGFKTANTDLFKETNVKLIKNFLQLLDPEFFNRHGNNRDIPLIGRNIVCIKNGSYVISVGHWDNGIKMFKNTNLVKTIGRAHTDFATCICCSQDEEYILTGSMDTNCKLWEIGSKKKLTLKHCLYGHDAQVTAVAMNKELDVVISASRDQSLIVHTLLSGKFIRSIYHGDAGQLIEIYEEGGKFVVYSSLTLFLYSINGKLLKQVDTASVVTGMLIKNDRLYYVEEKGLICCRNLLLSDDLDLLFKIDTKKLGVSNLYSLDMYKEFLFSGTEKGKIVVIKVS